MKRKMRLPAIALAFLMILTLLPPPAALANGVLFNGGTGSAGDPYQIASQTQLETLAGLVNAGAADTANNAGALYATLYYAVTAEIDLGGSQWTPIGLDDTHPFQGTFDGGGHTLSRFAIGARGSKNTTLDYLGLFGYISGATIQNTVLTNVAIYSSKSPAYAGSLAGYAGSGSTVTGCGAAGEIVGGESAYAGGLIGKVSGGTVSGSQASSNVTGGKDASTGGLLGEITGNAVVANCSASGIVTVGAADLGAFTGGLVGEVYTGSVTGSNATGAVSGGVDSDVGGLIGYIYSAGVTVTCCFATGNVTGGNGSYTGGLIGTAAGTVTDCHAGGSVSAGNGCRAGGFCAALFAAATNCYATGTVSGGDNSDVGGLAGYGSANVADSFATGAVSCGGSSYVGGLMGRVMKGTIQNSYATGSVTGGAQSYAGGLAGYARSADTVTTGCWASGAVTGGDSANAGGLTGYLFQSSVADCWASGAVTAGNGTDATAGGLIGYISSSTVQNSCSSGGATGGANACVGGFAGFNSSSTVRNCFAAGGAAGGAAACVGGFAGYVFSSASSILQNVYAAGGASGGASAYVGGFVGGLGNDAVVTCGYWNKDAAQTVDGVAQQLGTGAGVDAAAGKTAAELAGAGFLGLLCANASGLGDSTLKGWISVSDLNCGYPLLRDVGDGAGKSDAVAPVISEQPADMSVGQNGRASLSLSVTGDSLLYQWYSAAADTTLGGAPIGGAGSISYLADTSALGTAYYFCAVTNARSSGGVTYTAAAVSDAAQVTVGINAAPAALDVSLSGTEKMGRTLTGSYTYDDAEADPEGVSTFRWYRADDASGANAAAISGAVDKTYTLTNDDVGKYVCFEVTPVASAGTAAGTAVKSAYSGAVASDDAAAPVLSVQPADTVTYVGYTITLSVKATGSGVLSYQWYQNTSNSNSGGTKLAGETNASYSPTILISGTYYFYCVVTNTDSSVSGVQTAQTASDAAQVIISSAGSGSSSPSSSSSSTGSGTQTSAGLYIDGEAYPAASKVIQTVDGQTTTTVTLDFDTLSNLLAAKGSGVTVTVPLGDPDAAVGVLDGQLLQDLGTAGDTLVFQTGFAAFTLPAALIDMDAVGAQFIGTVDLSDIAVSFTISKPSDEMTQLAENAAKNGGYSIVVSPVEFSITCVYGRTTIEVSTFGTYVERMVALPEGTNPDQVTTAIVVGGDGTVRQVPTRIVTVDGSYYAMISSRTDSGYAVIWNRVEFWDVAGHWAKTAVNDLGSRLIVTGADGKTFAPDRAVTRAEFAAILVRALGLAPGTGSGGFPDVSASAWYCGYVETAVTYGILQGYQDGRFGPDDPITREQAVVMLAGAMDLTGLEAGLTDSEISTLLGAFADGASASAYAKDGIAACLSAGIVTGRSGGVLAPKETITRAEAAVMVRRLLMKSGLI